MKCGLRGEIKREEADLCYSIFSSLHLRSLVSIQMVVKPDLISVKLNVNFATRIWQVLVKAHYLA